MHTSVIDLPLKSSEPDTFGITPFKSGLVEFTRNSATPITIALQGEWGSGKTSLMNTLERDLCTDGEYHGVWLNTWEYALMKDAKDALIGILAGLIDGIMVILKQDDTQKKKMLLKLGKVVGNIATNIALTQANKLAENVGNIIADSLSDSGDKSIAALRDELENLISHCIEKDGNTGIIFFIDDLDRIDPPVAVQLLELLKNIFSLKKCIFILAIDYDVVIKGLEPKFGKFCEANEREFRSFFDKIIQLPFSMPVSSYSIDSFLSENLLSIKYLNKNQTQDKELINFLTQSANLTVGNNPRSLKRLLNSLSLIKCINKSRGLQEADEEDAELNLQVNFALVCLQVAHPKIYRMIDQQPGFDKWNEHTSLEFNLKNLTADQITKISKNEEFDETWEQVLFQACDSDLHLRKKALSISRLLNNLKALIVSKKENVGEVVESIISLSSVTSLDAFDKPDIDYHRGTFLKEARKTFIERLKEKLPEVAPLIQTQGKRVQTNAFIKLSEKDWEHWFKLFSRPHEGGIRLSVITDLPILQAATETEAETQLRKLDLWETLVEIRNDYLSMVEGYKYLTTYYLVSKFGYIYKAQYFFDMGLNIDLVSTEEFSNNTNCLDELVQSMAAIYKIRVRLVAIQNMLEGN